MPKRFNLVLLILFTFIIFFSSTSEVFSQTIDLSNFNGSYKVHVGDSNRYDYTIVLNTGKNYQTLMYFYPNGSFISYNLTKGVSFYIRVAEINVSSTSLQQLLVNESIAISGRDRINYSMVPNLDFIYPGFDSYSHAESYFKTLYSSTYTFSRSGNLINMSMSSTSSYNQTLSLTLTTKSSYVINWKTGWLEKRDAKSILSNGTIIHEIQFQRHSNTVLQRHSNTIITTIANISINILELIFLGILIAIPVLIGVSYQNYSRNSKISGNSQSFIQYLQKRFHYTKKKHNHVNNSETNRALETIEKILEETTDNTK